MGFDCVGVVVEYGDYYGGNGVDYVGDDLLVGLVG